MPALQIRTRPCSGGRVGRGRFNPGETAAIVGRLCQTPICFEILRATRPAQQNKSPRLKENRDDQDGDNVHHFDHGIDRRTGGVLIGIAHGVAGDRRRVRGRAFAAVIVLPRYIFWRYPRRHRCKSWRWPRTIRSQSFPPELRPERPGQAAGITATSDDERQRQQRRHDHFAQGRFGHDVDAGAVIRRVCAASRMPGLA